MENVADTPALVETTHGRLRGRWHDGVARFAGIPFAAPPVGDLRWRPPAPVTPWEGERAAEHFGPISPQNPSMMDALFGGETERWDEDCLYLNVWTTAPERATEGGGMPVMVWIHGGGFEMGSGSSPLYHGTHFAKHGVVLVSLNYRLGSLGFLELGDLDPSYAGSGNVGLLDQIAALEWVRDNIAAFGGDPTNVTIFGESAGAMSVSMLMAMPAARGLFGRVIAQSGHASAGRTPELAAADAEEFLGHGGWADLDALRAATTEELLTAHAAMSSGRIGDPERFVRTSGNPLAFLSFRPVADGRHVPVDPLAEIAAGASAGVELVCGTNAEEWKLFALMSPAAQNEEHLRKRLNLLVADADGALDAYRAEHPDATVAELESAFLTDLVFRIPATRLVEAHAPHGATYQYLWSWRSPAWGGMIGAAHAIELPFVFDLVEDHRLHVFVGPEAPAQLARATNEAWRTFAATGVPAAAGLPTWPTADGDGRPTMVLDTECALAHDPGAGTRQWWTTSGAERPALSVGASADD